LADLYPGELWRRQRGQIRASGGAGFVGAIWAIAIVVVEARDGEFDGRVRDASKCLGVLVELCNYRAISI
jgi:hypothetical protein